MRDSMAPQPNPPKKLRNTLEILGLCILLFGVVILYGIGAAGSSPAFAFGLALTIAAISIKPYQNWQSRRKAAKRYRYRLDAINQQLAGRSRASVLQTAPYDYSRWPDGDDCYVISDKRTDHIIHSVTGAQEAELWILEKTLDETPNLSSP